MAKLEQPLKLTVIFKSISPLFIADATSGDSVVTNDGYIRNGKIPNTTPITRTERKPALVTNQDGEEEIAYFPYIKANNIVGRLRRKVLEVVKEACREQGATISSAVYRGVGCGASSGTPSGEQGTLSDYIKASEHPIIGLLGGGDSIYPSGVTMTDANPIHKSLIDAGAVSSELESLATAINPLRMTYPNSLVRRDPMSDFKDLSEADVVEGGVETVDLWHQQVNDSKNGDTRLMLKNIVAYETALTGLAYASEVTFRSTTHDHHVGLFLECLSRLAQSNEMGGKVSKGLGRFNMTVLNGDDVILQSDNGNVKVHGGEAYFDAFSDAMENFDVKELDSFFE